MNKTSSTAGLQRRLQQRLETERQQIQSVTENALRRHLENSRRIVSDALRTIENDTGAATRRLSGLLLRAWLRNLVIGLSLLIGICAGSWGMMQWLSAEIRSLIEIKTDLEEKIAIQQQSLDRLQEGSWDVQLREDETGRFVVLPPGTLENPPWRWDGRPAVLLSRK